MDFLVQITVDLPASLSPDERDVLLAAELARGRELQAAGTIRHIWRVVGLPANVGVWSARNGDELHAAITSLPLYPWVTVTVVPLATHPLEADASESG